MDIEKRIAELYCSNPAAVNSLFINGRLYLKDEIRAMLKNTWINQNVPVLTF